MKRHPEADRAFVSILILILAASFPAAEGTDASAAASYAAKAEALYGSGNLAAASDMIETALRFDPDSSEALYLSALISLKSQEKTREGLLRLQKAIAKATWIKTDPDSAALALAEVLVRIGSLDEAIPLLERLAVQKSEDPRSSLFLARAYRRKGKPDLAEKTAETARKRFPKLEEAYLISADLAARAGRKAQARAVVAAGLSEIPESVGLLLKSLELDPDVKSRTAGIDAYFQNGGTDPLAAVIALEAKPKVPDKYYGLFISLGGLSRIDLYPRVSASLKGSKTLSTALAREMESFDGERIRDTDANGFYEEKWVYRSGKPSLFIRDANQDGAPELVSEFRGGRISTVQFDRDGTSCILRYDEYPYLESATETDGKGARQYYLTPRALVCPMANYGALSMDFSLPAQSQILSAAYRLDESAAGSAAVRSVDLSGGASVYGEQDTDGDGKTDAKTWFKDGKPIAGRKDLDGDGVFELSEIYAGGVKREQRIDEDGDGAYEYAEIFGASPSKLWDYNADGAWDSRETAASGGVVVREFSTKLDGTFDLRLEFRGGRIFSVMKNGVAVPVTKDEKLGAVWIGARAAVNSIPKEGAVVLGGRRYLVFRYLSTTYIEELE